MKTFDLSLLLTGWPQWLLLVLVIACEASVLPSGVKILLNLSMIKAFTFVFGELKTFNPSLLLAGCTDCMWSFWFCNYHRYLNVLRQRIRVAASKEPPNLPQMSWMSGRGWGTWLNITTVVTSLALGDRFWSFIQTLNNDKNHSIKYSIQKLNLIINSKNLFIQK